MPDNAAGSFPSPEEIQSQIEQQPPVEPAPRRNYRRVLMILLGVILLVFVIYNFWGSQVAGVLTARGAVNGITVDNHSNPVQAQISVLKTNLSVSSDANGNFLLKNVPAGAVNMIVAFDGQGMEIPVQIEAGKTIELGKIQVVSTQTAPLP